VTRHKAKSGVPAAISGMKRAIVIWKKVDKATLPNTEMKVRKYWYYYYFGECPVCGRNQSYRERRYTRKPKRRSQRFEHIPERLTYDYCVG
jgi:hypothetical protein